MFHHLPEGRKKYRRLLQLFARFYLNQLPVRYRNMHAVLRVTCLLQWSEDGTALDFIPLSPDPKLPECRSGTMGSDGIDPILNVFERLFYDTVPVGNRRGKALFTKRFHKKWSNFNPILNYIK